MVAWRHGPRPPRPRSRDAASSSKAAQRAAASCTLLRPVQLLGELGRKHLQPFGVALLVLRELRFQALDAVLEGVNVLVVRGLVQRERQPEYGGDAPERGNRAAFAARKLTTGCTGGAFCEKPRGLSWR